MENELNLDQKIIAAKKEFKPVLKNTVNGFLKTKYADLATVIDAIEESLSKHGLDYYQSVEGQETITVVPATEKTQAYAIMSGKSVVTTVTDGKDKRITYYPFISVIDQNKPEQKLGAVHTYDRRYGLLAAFGLKAEDNDAETTETTVAKKPSPNANAKNSVSALTQTTKPAPAAPAKTENTANDSDSLAYLKSLPGIKVEETETGVFVSGKTYPYSSSLKQFGFVFSAESKSWMKKEA